ncbi:hypothetical protein PVK06_007248 [Gossypium arboreum]|uniref:Reverse transcriptase zinc-binding domain-containing protein n=1 Tax=Gossypium arboreum TaxID=29729 RepID=A0ABR0QHT5_GOSAR|nr:hypothetical protein PVK06_007248 [Gossypium arboreum]
MALVGWDSICQPGPRGGLGFRYLRDQNNSFLMKIGFNLVTKENTLWFESFERSPLISQIPSHANLDLDCNLSDMVMPDGSWDLSLFRVWRGIDHSSSCPICGFEIEDTLHALRDCLAMKEACLQVIPIDRQSHLVSESL